MNNDHRPLPLLSDTPNTAISSAMPSPDLSSSTNSIEELLLGEIPEQPHTYHHAHNIFTDDIRQDPILSKLAKGQGLIPTSSEAVMKERAAFKARPAPSNMHDKAVGPRMSKAAALRMGLEWDDKKVGGERRAVDFASTPGHKRNNLSLDIASLSRPTLAPRQNRASQLRSGEPVASMANPVRHTAEEVSVAVQSKLQEDKARRRQSMTLPASLSAPSITPRMNRSAALRTGGSSKLPPTSFDRYLTSTSANNVPLTPKTKESPQAKPKTPTSSTFDVTPTPKDERRKSIMGSIRSLGAPSIAPRLNKAAMLRTPQSATSSTIPGLPFARTNAPPTVRQPPSSYRPSSAGSRPPTAPLSRTSSVRSNVRPPATEAAESSIASAVSGPRPTRASMLRAGLGAKILTSR